jgi:hypothetical protein
VMLSAGNIFFWTLWATCLCGLGVLAMLCRTLPSTLLIVRIGANTP